MISDIAIVLLFIAASLASIRLLRGPALADRIIALDVILVSLMGAIAIRAAATSDTTYLGIVSLIAIVAFTATVALSRFIEQTGQS